MAFKDWVSINKASIIHMEMMLPMAAPFAECTAFRLSLLISNLASIYVNVIEVFCLSFDKRVIPLNTDMECMLNFLVVRTILVFSRNL